MGATITSRRKDGDVKYLNGFVGVINDDLDVIEQPLSMDLKPKGTSASDSQINMALGMIAAMCKDPRLGQTGRRNDDAVDLCIAVHVLGYDAEEWIPEMLANHRIDPFDYTEFLGHVERVTEYLDSWGPVGNEGDALDKRIVHS